MGALQWCPWNASHSTWTGTRSGKGVPVVNIPLLRYGCHLLPPGISLTADAIQVAGGHLAPWMEDVTFTWRARLVSRSLIPGSPGPCHGPHHRCSLLWELHGAPRGSAPQAPWAGPVVGASSARIPLRAVSRLCVCPATRLSTVAWTVEGSNRSIFFRNVGNKKQFVCVEEAVSASVELLQFIAGEFSHVEPKAYLSALGPGCSEMPHCTRDGGLGWLQSREQKGPSQPQPSRRSLRAAGAGNAPALYGEAEWRLHPDSTPARTGHPQRGP